MRKHHGLLVNQGYVVSYQANVVSTSKLASHTKNKSPQKQAAVVPGQKESIVSVLPSVSHFQVTNNLCSIDRHFALDLQKENYGDLTSTIKYR